MNNKIETTEVVIFSRNGFDDDAKFVEVDGKKFEADPTDPTKAKVGEDGKPVPFVEKKPNDDKGGNKSLEELAKTNPEVAKLLDDKKKLEDAATKAAADAKKKAEEDAAKNGEWQKLAETRGTELEEAKKQLGQKEEMLGKYVGSVKEILKQVMETIPKDKHGLIPDNFSPREKLEYITRNAKLLGANVSGKGGGVPPNDTDAPVTDEAKLVAEIEELKKKENKTQSDHTKIFELSKKLKELRGKKAQE